MITIDKKVLLRERKRHTARRVASTPYVVLTGYPPQPGYPPSQGTPPGAGYPPGRVPPLAGPGRVPPRLPHGILGNVAKHYGIRVPPPDVNRLKTLPSPILRMRAVKILTLMHIKQHNLEQCGHSRASRNFSIQIKHLKTSAKL